VYAGQQKHVSRAMVEAWCNAAKANASPAAMHKLLQVHMCWAHVMVIVTVHSAVALAVRFVWQCPVQLSCPCKACDNTCHGCMYWHEYLYNLLADVSHVLDLISADKLQITGPVSEGNGQRAQLSKPNDGHAGTASQQQKHEKLVFHFHIKWLLLILLLLLFLSSSLLQRIAGMQAYRLACHYGDTEEQVHETMKISSSAVFNKLMLFVLKEGNHIFLRMLSLDELTVVTARDVQRSKRMRKVEGLLKSFLGNSLHLLGELCLRLSYDAFVRKLQMLFTSACTKSCSQVTMSS